MYEKELVSGLHIEKKMHFSDYQIQIFLQVRKAAARLYLLCRRLFVLLQTEPARGSTERWKPIYIQTNVFICSVIHKWKTIPLLMHTETHTREYFEPGLAFAPCAANNVACAFCVWDLSIARYYLSKSKMYCTDWQLPMYVNINLLSLNSFHLTTAAKSYIHRETFVLRQQCLNWLLFHVFPTKKILTRFRIAF